MRERKLCVLITMRDKRVGRKQACFKTLIFFHAVAGLPHSFLATSEWSDFATCPAQIQNIDFFAFLSAKNLE